MQHVEIGLNSRELIWREHVLSDKLRENNVLSNLIWEPILGSSGKSIFTIVPEIEIGWNWNDWAYAEKTICDGKPQATNRTPMLPQIIKYPEQSSASLKNIGRADTVEIIFHGEQGQTGAVKQRLSDKAYEENIIFDHNFYITVRGELPTETLIAEKYKKFGVNRLEKIHTSRFEGNRRILIPSVPFGQLVAIVKQNGRKRKMIRCMAIGFDNQELVWMKAGNEEQENLKLGIEGELDQNQPAIASEKVDWSEWLDTWSRISQEKFLKLADFASNNLNLSRQEAHRLTQLHPTGLYRALILHILGCPYIKTNWWKVESLDDADDFFTSVSNIKKGLAEILAAMPTLEEKLWAIREAENDCLPLAFKNVGGSRLPVLRRELHLLEKRREAVRVREGKKTRNNP